MKLRDSDERRVERETLLPARPEEVWEALTDAERLAEWLAREVEIEPYEGGEIAARDDDGERTGTVETVVEAERLSFTWGRPGEAPTRVDLTLQGIPLGTRLTVVETVFGPEALAAHSAWAPRLARLERALALVLA